MITEGLTFIFKAPDEASPEENKYKIELENIGLRVSVIPSLEFNFINSSTLASKLADVQNFGGIILTSPRCVEAVNIAIKLLENWESFLHSKWDKLPCYVVGPATATAVKEKLGLNTIKGLDCGNSEGLMKFILEDKTNLLNPNLLYPCGNLKTNKILDSLIKAELSVDTITAYETIPNSKLRETLQDEIVKGYPEYVIFFSPSGVKNVLPIFKDLNFLLSGTKFCAIGETTRQAIISNGLSVWCTAENPTPNSLKEGIQAKLF